MALASGVTGVCAGRLLKVVAWLFPARCCYGFDAGTLQARNSADKPVAC